MTLALRYLVSDPTRQQSPTLSSHNETEETGHTRPEEDSTPSRQVEAEEKLNQLEVSVKDLEKVVGSLPDMSKAEGNGNLKKKEASV